jgi:uncharacterized protein (TIGR03437 family)
MRKAIRLGLGILLSMIVARAAVVKNRMHIETPNYPIAILATAVDSQGFIYITGATAWSGFPTTPGTLSTYSGGGGFSSLSGDVFVQKLQPGTFQVVYSVLVGGSKDDIGTGIVVDAQGNACVTGYTDSNDFPGSARASNRTDRDAFVFEVNAAGTALVFSHLYGGSGDDYSFGIAKGPDGSFTTAGQTDSPDFPTTPNAVQSAWVPLSGPFGPQTDAFVLRIGSNGADIQYATYLGGPGNDNATSVAVDSAGDIYLAGQAGAYFPTLDASYAPYELYGGFVTKISQATGDLIYSTYLPGTNVASALMVDATGNAYLCGTATVGFPATPGAYQSDLAGGSNDEDAFALELDASGSSLVFATLIGSPKEDYALALTLQGNAIVIAGETTSTFFPTTNQSTASCDLDASPYYSFQNDPEDPFPFLPLGAFLASFDHTGKLLSSAAYSACASEYVTALVPSASGSIYLAAWDDEENDTFLAEVDPAGSLPAQISFIADSASFEGGPLAPLELISIFGKGLGPATPAVAGITEGRLPTSLGGTQVFVHGEALPLLFVSDSQVNAILPQDAFNSYNPYDTALNFNVIAGGNGTQTYSTYSFPGVPRLFTSNGLGFGQIAALNEDGSLNSPQNPAARGSFISLFGTGGGVTMPAFADGQVATAAAPVVQPGYMVVGLDLAPILYVGAAPEEVNGVVQINVTIPMTVSPGPTVPVRWALLFGDDLYIFSQPGISVAVK